MAFAPVGPLVDGRPRRNVIVVLLASGVAVVGASIALDQFGGSAPNLWLLATPVVLLVLYIASLGPKWSVALLIAATIFGYSTSAITVGSSLDIRIPDLFYVILFGWALVIRARGGQRGHLVGRSLLAVWFGVLGLSLYPQLVQGEIAADALIPWLRLVATFSLVWLVPYALRSRRDIEFALGALGAAATITLGLSVLGAALHGNVSTRLSGVLGPDTTGLVAVWVVILALHGPPVARPRSLRLVMLVVGSAALLMTRSLGSTAALVVALGLYGLTNRGSWRTEQPGLITPFRLLLLVIAGLVLATTLRPLDLPGSPAFRSSSTAQRVLMADAGLRIFAEHPVMGTGWQRSSEVVRSVELNDELRERWGGEIAENLFPRQFRGHTPTVHNSYIQVLAEAGALGFAVFLGAVIAVGIGVFRVLRDAHAVRLVFLSTRAVVVLLVATMVWLNDNPLYGAQPETVMTALFLGILAAVPPILHTSVPTPE